MKQRTVTLDGIDFTDDITFAYKLRYAQTQNKAESVKFIDKFSLHGKAFAYVNDIYFVKRQIRSIIEVRIAGCCGEMDRLTIDYRSVRNTDCIIEATPTLTVSDAYDRLRDTIWWQNDFYKNNENFKVWYCSGFSVINWIVMPIYLLLAPIVKLIKKLPKWLVGKKPELAMEELERGVHGCMKYHNAYSIREVLEYQCNVLGLKFNSHVLQNTKYRNLIFLPCSFSKGWNNSQEPANFNFDNAPAYSVLQLLEIFKPVFNARYWIADNTLYFDPIFIADVPDDYLFDITGQEGLTYEFVQDSGWAYGRFEYMSDALDYEGNELGILFNDVVEWNNPPEKWQKGSRDVQLNDFSPAAFMFDGTSTRLVDTLRMELTGNAGDMRFRDLLLSSGLSAQMKLLLYDPAKSNSGKQNAHCEYIIGAAGVPRYNPSLRFNEKQDGITSEMPSELYNNFYIQDDPRNVVYVRCNEIVIHSKNFCNFAQHIDKYGVSFGIKSKYGNGLARGVEVDKDRKTIKLIDVRWRLQY